MTSNESSGKIKFLDKEFDLKLLEQAIGKSGDSKIEKGKEVHSLQLDQSKLPEAWKDKFKKPVVTLHEGKYLVIFLSGWPALTETVDVPEKKNCKGDVVEPAKTITVFKNDFIGRFVTKYNFNQAKVVPPPPPVEVEPAASRPSYPKRDYNPQWKPNNGFSGKNHGNGTQNGSRRFGSK